MFGAQFILAPLAQTYDCAKLNCALKFKNKKSKYKSRDFDDKTFYLILFSTDTCPLLPASLENTYYTCPVSPFRAF
jgi:hypothetical protein